MSDENYDDDDNESESDETATIKNLRKAQREGVKAAEERDRLARENAFLRAGIPETPGSGYFVKGYDGELDTESIRTAAIEAGFLTKPDEDAGGVDADEQAAHERVQQAAGGSVDTAPPGYAEDLQAAKTQEEAIAVMEKYGQKLGYSL